MSCLIWIFKNIYSLTILFFLLQTAEPRPHMIDNSPHHLQATLDPEGRYILEWNVDFAQERITFLVTAQTTGYVGFGLSTASTMFGADLVIGGVNSDNQPYFADYHVPSSAETRMPIRDRSQDWTFLSARENGTHTQLSFSRAFDTCDDPYDLPITANHTTVIWSLGQSDEIRYHGRDNRGTYPVYLLDPDYCPPIVTEASTGTQLVLDSTTLEVDPSIKAWTLNQSLAVPPQETTYWCTMNRTPRLQSKSQLIGYNIRFHNPEAERHLHHFILYHCIPPPGTEARELFDEFVGGPGESCLNPYIPSGSIPIDYCTEFSSNWAIGGRAHFQPPEVGLPFASEDYYILQLHLDNPELLQGVQVDFSVDFFYTDRVREHEGGYVVFRQEIPGLAPSLLVPPGSQDHLIRGICGEECSNLVFPPGGITIYGGLLHTHNAGRKARLRHFRDGAELPPILFDDNYSFAYQQVRTLRRPRRVLPGDQVVAECVYEAGNRTVVGGLASSQEMCALDMLHYPRLTEIQSCDSQSEPVLWARRYFLAGVENVSYSEELVDYVVDPPHRLAGLPVARVSDEYVDWTEERRGDLRRFQSYHPHVNSCSRERWARPEGTERDPGRLVTYPYEAVPYREPERNCMRRY